MLNTLRERIRLAGPGLIWAAAAIGSGEVVIGTKVGAEHGYAFLWALWLGIALKWSIHRGILDLTALSGKNVVDLWHERRFGRLISAYWLLFFLLTITGLSGLLGLTSAALHLFIPVVSASVWAVIVVVGVVALIYYGRYKGLEKLMLTVCLVLVLSVLGSVFLARPEPLDLVRDWSVPSSISVGLLLLSLLGWGAGSGPDLILPYSTWVLEKGSTDWRQRPEPEPALGSGVGGGATMTRVRRIPQILHLGRTDLASGYIVTGIVASGFMIAGAALLAPRGLAPKDNDVIKTLSTILTDTYGGWAFTIFVVGAIAALLSTFIGVLDGAYLTVHRLVSLLRNRGTGVVADRSKTLGRAVTLAVFAVTPLMLFLVVQQPVTLVIISGLVSAVSMPVLGVLVFVSFLRSNFAEYRPTRSYLASVIIATVLYVILMIISITQLW